MNAASVNADGMTAAQLERAAEAYEKMAAGTYAGRPDQGYCEDQAERARAEAAALRGSGCVACGIDDICDDRTGLCIRCHLAKNANVVDLDQVRNSRAARR